MKFRLAIAFCLLIAAAAAHADDFYKGKQIRLIAGFASGSVHPFAT
jgi:hypothetical protein